MSTGADAVDLHARAPDRRRYAAVLTFAGGWWSVEIPDLPGVVTHTSDPHGADAAVREAIAHRFDADPSLFEVELEFVDNPPVTHSRRGPRRHLTRRLVAGTARGR